MLDPEPSDLFWVLINDPGTTDEQFLIHCVNLSPIHLQAIVDHRPYLMLDLCRLGSKALAIHYAYREFDGSPTPVYDRLCKEMNQRRIKIPIQTALV